MSTVSLELPELVDLYRYGFSTPEIGRLYGTSEAPVASRLRKLGILKRAGQRTISDTARFWLQVTKSEGCWLWTGSLAQHGYGQFSRANRGIRAHRYAWEAERGLVPAGKVVRHKCHNRACVRVEHLELGSHADNMRDMTSAGRQARGDKTASRAGSGLGWEGARAIRSLVASGLKQREVARRFGVSPALVCLIAKGERWPE